MARVDEGSHTQLSTSGMSPHNMTAWLVLISRPAEGRRLNWSGWLDEILRWFTCLKTVTHPSTNGTDVECLG